VQGLEAERLAGYGRVLHVAWGLEGEMETGCAISAMAGHMLKVRQGFDSNLLVILQSISSMGRP
jgi:hypothetical protein